VRGGPKTVEDIGEKYRDSEIRKQKIEEPKRIRHLFGESDYLKAKVFNESGGINKIKKGLGVSKGRPGHTWGLAVQEANKRISMKR